MIVLFFLLLRGSFFYSFKDKKNTLILVFDKIEALFIIPVIFGNFDCFSVYFSLYFFSFSFAFLKETVNVCYFSYMPFSILDIVLLLIFFALLDLKVCGLSSSLTLKGKFLQCWIYIFFAAGIELKNSHNLMIIPIRYEKKCKKIGIY